MEEITHPKAARNDMALETIQKGKDKENATCNKKGISSGE